MTDGRKRRNRIGGTQALPVHRRKIEKRQQLFAVLL